MSAWWTTEDARDERLLPLVLEGVAGLEERTRVSSLADVAKGIVEDFDHFRCRDGSAR